MHLMVHYPHVHGWMSFLPSPPSWWEHHMNGIGSMLHCIMCGSLATKKTSIFSSRFAFCNVFVYFNCPVVSKTESLQKRSGPTLPMRIRMRSTSGDGWRARHPWVWCRWCGPLQCWAQSGTSLPFFGRYEFAIHLSSTWMICWRKGPLFLKHFRKYLRYIWLLQLTEYLLDIFVWEVSREVRIVAPRTALEVPIGLQVLYSYRRSPFPSTVYLCSIIFVSVSEIE